MLIATSIGVTLSHLDWVKVDHGHLLVVDGRPLDVQGWLANQINLLRRDCTAVQVLPPQDANLALALRGVKEFSPPASRTARASAAWASGHWMLIDVAFDDLLPAVVLMQKDGPDWRIAPKGIWSGQTHPWLADPLIRDYLARQVPAAPAPLLACFDSQAVPPRSSPLK